MRTWWGLVRTWSRTHPVALGFAAMVAMTSLVAAGAGIDPAVWGAGPLSVLAEGRWWTPLTALVVAGNPADAALAIVLGLVLLGGAEDVLGHVRALAATAVAAVGGLLVAVSLHAALWGVTALRPVEAEEVPVLDPVMTVIAGAMAATGPASALWRRRVRLIGFTLLITLALYVGDAQSWYRLSAALAGLVVGAMLARSRPARPWHRSSSGETRSLVAALIAVTGAGPLAAVVTGSERGPLSIAIDAFAQYDQDVVARCAETYRPVCDQQVALVITRGVGPALLAAMPLILLLVAALGLRTGRRAGLVLAITVEGALATMAVLMLVTGRLVIDAWTDGSGAEYVLWAAADLGVPIAAIALLVTTRRAFRVRATRTAARRLGVTIAVAWVVCAVVFIAGEWVLRRSFATEPSLFELVVSGLRRFVPPVFLESTASTPFPRHGVALWIYQWVGVAFWTVVIVGVLVLYRRPAHVADRDAERYRRMLRRGSGTLGHLGTWSGCAHWFGTDGGAVAYRLEGDVALAVSDPLTADGDPGPVMRGFADFCASRAWTPVFYSVHDAALPASEAMGWSRMPVGQETVLILDEVDVAGKAWQKVRQPMVRAQREGVRAVWTSWRELTPGQVLQVEEINEQWVADKALPEMGFTLGSLDEVKDPDVAILLAVDAHERIQAVTSWLPGWRDGRRVSWTLDFMRRRPDGPNGMMEFLIASAVLRMQADGIQELSLSGAPLALDPHADAEADPTALGAVLATIATALEPAYGFESLFRFKRKFHPQYRTLWILYPDPLQLPRIGAALGRAYLPDATARELVTLARSALGERR